MKPDRWLTVLLEGVSAVAVAEADSAADSAAAAVAEADSAAAEEKNTKLQPKTPEGVFGLIVGLML